MAVQNFLSFRCGITISIETDPDAVKNATGYTPGKVFLDYKKDLVVLVGVGEKLQYAFFRHQDGRNNNGVFHYGHKNIRSMRRILSPQK